MERFLADLKPLWVPHEGQRTFLLHPSKYKVLACGRRWGKTDACAVQVLASLIQEQRTKHVLIAPTQGQAALLFDRALELLREFLELRGEEERPLVRGSPYPTFSFRGHRVTARSGHLGHALRGQGATHLVIDEAAFVAPSLITEVAMPMLATTDGSMTLLSTPKGKGLFWRLYRHGELGEHGFWSRRAPSAESPMVSESFLKIQRELVSDRAFRVEYEAEFLDDAGQVFPMEAIEASLTLELPPLDRNDAVCIGVDWGRYKDFSAVAVVSGHQGRAVLREVESFNQMDWRDQVARVAALVQRYPGAIVHCDRTGVGDPVTESLLFDSGASVHGVLFTKAAKEGLIGRLRWLLEGRCLSMLPHPDLLRQLEHFQAVDSPSGAVLGAPHGYHDDLVYALALATHGLRRPGRPGILLGGRRPLL